MLLRRLVPQPFRQSLKEALNRWITSRGYVAFDIRKHYAEDGLYSVHNAGFRKDPKFAEAYLRGVRAGHGVDPRFGWRVHVALWAASAATRVPGDFVECGVNAGLISSAIMHYLDWSQVPRKYFLVDTFAGPVLEQFSIEERKSGWAGVVEKMIASGGYVTDMNRIRTNFAEWPNAVIVQGIVPEVLPSVNTNEVAFLHLDLNCAYPERAALEYFWDLVSPGGVILLDDYAHHRMDAQKQSIDEWASLTRTVVLALPTGQGLIIR
jgi:hypothetical protein